MDLFDHQIKQNINFYEPLAARMRPNALGKFVGQNELIGKDKVLRQMIENDQLSSLIFWGPPGSGKTTLAKIIAEATKAHFVPLSAVTTQKSKVKEICAKAYADLKYYRKRTILFFDEIHRFNKAQQDTFLPFVEKGIIILIGATTENPSFEINNALLSRCQVFVLKRLSDENLKQILTEALGDKTRGLGNLNLKIEDSALKFLAEAADGDARTALNTLEMAANIVLTEKEKEITLKSIEKAIQRRALRYDKHGEEHFNLISALHKSLRNSDENASLYWLSRMLESGESPRYILRRMIRFAVEDIGLADPEALKIAIVSLDAFEFIGRPEGDLVLAECAIYLARAPKDNSLYIGFSKAQKDALDFGSLPVPLALRNAETKLMKDLGYGEGYKYAHHYENKKTDLECLPKELKGRKYVNPN